MASGTTARIGLEDDAEPGPAELLSGHALARTAAETAQAGALDRGRLRVARHCCLLVYVELKAAAFLRGIPLWAAVAIVVVAVVPAAFRRRWPRTVLALVVTAGAVATAISSSPVPPLAAAFVIYMIPLRFPRRDALCCWPARCW